MAKKKKKQQQGAEDGGAATDPRVAVVAHPRARASIRRWHGRAGLIGLVAVTLLSLRAGVPGFDAVMRGLAAGVAAQFVAWATGVLVWRHLVIAELTIHREAQEAAAEKRRAAAQQRAADALSAAQA